MQLTRRAWMKGAAGTLLAGTLLPALPARAATTTGGAAFGTYWRATLPADADTQAAAAAIKAVIAMVDTSMSPFGATSEISRFNRARNTQWTPVSAPLHTVVAESLSVAVHTNGAFEPTLGPLVHRFGFGPITGGTGGSYADIAIRQGAIRKHRPDLTLDLCSIAKGYALDRMANALDALHIRNFMIELGGELFAQGTHPAGRPWQVAIERPIQGPIAFERVLQLEGRAVATSGDTINSVELAGRRYSHIIDPRTQKPVDNAIASVSVIAPTAMRADAWATALMAAGIEHGMDLAESHSIPALFLVREGKTIREYFTTGFSDHLAG
jgi:thiamine biosynthesis lipoprotein